MSVPCTPIHCTGYTFALVFFTSLLLSISPAEEAYTEPPLDEKGLSHWAFQPLAEYKKDLSIDHFILKKLRSKNIESFAPRAEKSILLRRLHFHLIGLPPTPEDIENFILEKYTSTIENLLARPQYGEHWAQHWLDVARFAETDGYEHDKVRPDAWRYRDWVIDALNRDLPYDQFIAAQIAGDELFPEDEKAKFATAFLFCGPDMPDINLESERRHNVLNEATGAVGSAFLGLTMACAQCHDHKSDPISQADFYRLRSFFDNAKLPPKNKSLPHFFPETGNSITQKSILRIRGDFRRTGPDLEPAFIRVINPQRRTPQILEKASSSGRRSALAKWLSSPQNPLTARVIVNRVWHHHFGRGIVETPNDFGKYGERPSHPELLDWLAADFVENGWSLKRLHRQILLSKTWQQSSLQMEGDSEWENRLQLDPENRLLSRHSRIRLSGETIRDAMLSATGELNPKAGGPGFRPPLPEEITVTLLRNQWPVTKEKSEHYRRSIYLFARRNLKYPFFDAFDRPAANQSCARRHLSTTAPQSLILLNSAFSNDRAKKLAENLENLKTTDDQIRTAFLLTTGRAPDTEEFTLSRNFLSRATLNELALAMFNRNEFIFLD